MRKYVIASCVFGFFLLFVAQTAIADVSPKATMTISTAIQKLQAKGYKNIHEVKYKNGFYEAEVETVDGVELLARVNSKTGQVELPKTPAKRLTLSELIKKVDAAGYKDISEISVGDDEFEVVAMDKDGKKVRLELDATKGNIKKGWF